MNEVCFQAFISSSPILILLTPSLDGERPLSRRNLLAVLSAHLAQDVSTGEVLLCLGLRRVSRNHSLQKTLLLGNRLPPLVLRIQLRYQMSLGDGAEESELLCQHVLLSNFMPLGFRVRHVPVVTQD